MHFPRLDVDQIKIRPIEKGGSDRKFYRIHCGADPAAAGLILVKYNLEREENRHYVQIAQLLFPELSWPLFQGQRVKTQGAGRASGSARSSKTPCEFAKSFGAP